MIDHRGHKEISEMFADNRLGLTPSEMRCLDMSNLVASPHSGTREKSQDATR